MSWPTACLAEVVQFLDSRRRPVKESERVEGPYPYYGANGQQGWIDGFLFDEPLILLAEDGGHFDNPSRGIAYAIEGKSWVNNHAHVLRATDRVDFRYLLHSLKNRDVRSYITGSTRAKLTKDGASRIEIPLPPLDEQRRIAAMLDKAEELRAKRRAAIALLDQLPQAIFLEMFGDPATNPKKWPWVPIQALVQNITNWNPAKLSGEFQYVDISSIDSESKEIVGIRQIVAADAPSRARQRIQSGDVLVSTVRPNLNAVALVREIDDTGTASTGFCVLRPQTKRAVSSYLFNWVRSKPFIESMVRQATGASYPAVTDRIVKAFEVFDVPLELQQHFAARAEAIHRTKAVHQSALAELDALFTSLQWSAFSGDCG